MFVDSFEGSIVVVVVSAVALTDVIASNARRRRMLCVELGWLVVCFIILLAGDNDNDRCSFEKNIEKNRQITGG